MEQVVGGPQGILPAQYYSILASVYLKKPEGGVESQHVGIQAASGVGKGWGL